MKNPGRILCVIVTCWTLMVLGLRPAAAQGYSGPPSYKAQRPEEPAGFMELEQTEILPDAEHILPAPPPPPPELFSGGIRSLVKSAGVTATHLFGSGDDGLAISDVSVRASIFTPTPIKKIPFLIAIPSCSVRSLNAPGAIGLPSELYATSLSVSWMHKWSDRTNLMLGIGGGVYSDFEATDGAFRITGHAMATTQLNERWEMMWGAVVLNQGNIPVLPVAGFVYKPDADTRIELAAPRPRYAKRIDWFEGIDSGDNWAYLAGEFDGGRYAVMRPGGIEDTVNFRDFRLVAGIEGKRPQGINSQFEVGYVFGRNISFENDPTEFEPTNTLMLRAGFSY